MQSRYFIAIQAKSNIQPLCLFITYNKDTIEYPTPFCTKESQYPLTTLQYTILYK